MEPNLSADATLMDAARLRALGNLMNTSTDLLQALPVAVYTTDADGRITFYNDAAAALWGHRPELGSSHWCGSWRLFFADGRPMRHDECPMAMSLRQGEEVRGLEAIAERPDGTRIPFRPYPTLLCDADGKVTGAINLLIDLSDQIEADIKSARLAAIVASSDDAIVSKNLDGRVTSWNAGATRIFGYEPEEMIGQPILKIIPIELQEEEREILAKLRRGERVDHFDTVRLAKDGRRVNISVTISPITDKTGRIVGASKVARDVTDRKQSEALQRLLFDELNHRVKNTLATIQALARHSLRTTASPKDFVDSFSGRIQALGRAHDLLVAGKMQSGDMHGLVREQVALGTHDGTRISCSGPVVDLSPQMTVQLALVMHELATNARKYGALSVPTGQLSIEWKVQQMPTERQLLIDWKESGVPNLSPPTTHGFGTSVIERSLEASGGAAIISYDGDGLACRMRIPLGENNSLVLPIPPRPADLRSSGSLSPGAANFAGKRILVVEDEPLVAIDVYEQLTSIGCEVIGPAHTIEAARRLIAEGEFDAVLLDANLRGHPVDDLAVALKALGRPFAFATGYGRDALPLGFRDAPVLTKPFDSAELLATLKSLFGEGSGGANVVRLELHR